MVRAFLEVESLEASPGYAHVQRRLLKESGLIAETPQTLLAMRAVLDEYREYKSKTNPKG